MENQETTEKSYSLYYILSLIFWVATCCVYVFSLESIIIGAIIGLVSAAFYVNVLVKDRE